MCHTTRHREKQYLGIGPGASASGHWPSSWFRYLYPTVENVVKSRLRQQPAGIAGGMKARSVLKCQYKSRGYTYSSISPYTNIEDSTSLGSPEILSAKE